MANEHQRAVKAAERTNVELGTLFGKMGTTEHPRGAILAAYRQARRAIAANINNPQAVEEILFDLRIAVESSLRLIYSDAAALGVEQATRQVLSYGLPETGAELALQLEEAVRATLAQLDAQIGSARVLAFSTKDVAMLVGTANRVGLLSPAPIVREGARHSAHLTNEAQRQVFDNSIQEAGAPKSRFLRQAIAGIDERTTDCCLRVHGQIVGIDANFKLMGTPRYADELHAPPFHWYCRTAVVLIHRDMQDNELTDEMRDAARAEIKAREETGVTVEIHPASALSRR